MAKKNGIEELRQDVSEWCKILEYQENRLPFNLVDLSIGNVDQPVALVGRVSDPATDTLSGRLYILREAGGSLKRTSDRFSQVSSVVCHPNHRTLACVGAMTGGHSHAWLLDPATNDCSAIPTGVGEAEQVFWNADGSGLWILAGDPGTSKASIDGAISQGVASDDTGNWRPLLNNGISEARRRLFYHDGERSETHELQLDLSVWDAAALGTDGVVITASEAGLEDDWYNARFFTYDHETGQAQLIYAPQNQITAIAASRDSASIAFVEGLASDRGSLAGELKLYDCKAKAVFTLDAGGVDITWTGWSARGLHAAGIAGDDTVFMTFEDLSGDAQEDAVLPSQMAGVRYPKPAISSCGWHWFAITRSPCDGVKLIKASRRKVVSLHKCADAAYTKASRAYGTERLRHISWETRDGTTVGGWLHTPSGEGPFPMVVMLHGGPISRWTPRSLYDMPMPAMLARFGIA